MAMTSTPAAAPVEGGTKSAGILDRKTAEAPTPAMLFDRLADLLHEARQTDEAHQHSGDSNRLLRVAEWIASDAQNPEWDHPIRNTAFDIAALIRAARLVPGDEESVLRSALIQDAGDVLSQIAGTSTKSLITPDARRPALLVGEPEEARPRSVYARAGSICLQAKALMSLCMESVNSDLFAAGKTILDGAIEAGEQAESDETAEAGEDFSRALCYSIAVIEAVAEAAAYRSEAGPAAYGIVTLLDTAKDMVDGAITAQMRAAH